MSFSFPGTNLERRGNYAPCEQNTKVALGARVDLCVFVINVENKFHNKRFQKAPKIDKHV